MKLIAWYWHKKRQRKTFPLPFRYDYVLTFLSLKEAIKFGFARLKSCLLRISQQLCVNLCTQPQGFFHILTKLVFFVMLLIVLYFTLVDCFHELIEQLIILLYCFLFGISMDFLGILIYIKLQILLFVRSFFLLFNFCP